MSVLSLGPFFFRGCQMIKRLTIKNLQAHKDTTIDLVAPGVNVIVGKSSQGKTSIIRALAKLIQNRPVIGVESWIHGHDKKRRISIQVDTTDGRSILWSGPSDQQYIVDGQEYKGFGQSVPAPVVEALGINDINIQTQFDPPFLVFDPPGQVARYLNQVADLEVIDRAIQNVNSMARANTREQETSKNRISGLQDAIDSFPDLESAEEFISGLEALSEKLSACKMKLSRLSNIMTQLGQLRASLGFTRLPEGINERIDAMIALKSHLDRSSYTKGLLTDIQSNLTSMTQRLSVLVGQSAHLPKVDILINSTRLLAKQKSLLNRTRMLQSNLQAAKNKRDAALSKLSSLQTDFDRLWPGVCPLCGYDTGKEGRL